MITLTKEITNILDKLYNLRGEDSEVLIKMETEKEKAEETKLRTTKEKESLQSKITSLLEEESEIKEQGDKLSTLLAGINEDDYKVVIEKLGLDFNPKKIKEKLDASLPETLEVVAEDTKKAKEELQNVETLMNDAITKIEELAIRKDAAIQLQEKLNEYFDLALNGNINITRDAITSLLEKFGFSEEEQREAAKILMFPEDALYEYDKNHKGGKSISEVIAEAKEFSDTKSIEIKDILKAEEKISNDKIRSLLDSLGIDTLDYTSSDLDSIALNYDEEVIKNNVNYAKNVSLPLDIFADNVSLLTDKEFINKVEKLLSIGKSIMDIYLNPNALLKYDFKGLIHAIDLLKESNLDPKMVPLMAF